MSEQINTLEQEVKALKDKLKTQELKNLDTLKKLLELQLEATEHIFNQFEEILKSQTITKEGVKYTPLAYTRLHTRSLRSTAIKGLRIVIKAEEMARNKHLTQKDLK